MPTLCLALKVLSVKGEPDLMEYLAWEPRLGLPISAILLSLPGEISLLGNLLGNIAALDLRSDRNSSNDNLLSYTILEIGGLSSNWFLKGS